MTIASGSTRHGRVHRVVAELDGRGEIDAHAALCLRHAIDAAQAGRADTVLVDLRDLTAIDRIGVALFRAHNGDCHSHGKTLGLLISGEERHRPIADAFGRGGLGETLRYAHEPREPASAHPVSRIDSGSSAGGRPTRAARRVSPQRARRRRAAGEARS